MLQATGKGQLLAVPKAFSPYKVPDEAKPPLFVLMHREGYS